MKKIGVLVIGHVGIDHGMLDLLLHRLEHTHNYDLIVFGASPKKENKTIEQMFEEFAFKNHHKDIDFELKLAELDLTISGERLWVNRPLNFEKVKLDEDYKFLSSNKGLLNFKSRGVRPP